MDGSSCTGQVAGVSSISGIVLAGGESRRMGGVNKALLEVGGVSIIERVAASLRKVFEENLVITNTPEAFEFLGLPMVRDLIPGHGSLGGLYTGLCSCQGVFGFLVACDMPFLDPRVMRHMVSLVGQHDVVIPVIAGRLQPLHAIYSRRCIGPIERMMGTNDLSIINLFHEVNVLEVPEKDLVSFDACLRFAMNINTPEDLQRARTLAARTRSA